MDARRKIVFYAVASVLVVALAAVLFWPRGRDQQQAESLATSANQQAAKAAEKSEPGTIVIGGVRRRVADVQPAKPAAAAIANDPKAPKPYDPMGYGRAKPIQPDANPQVAKLAETLRDHKHSERGSAMAAPRPFDANAYQANPASYTEVVEPSRVFAPAKPGPGVPRLEPMGHTFQQITQGSTVKLKALAPAGAPVTFASMDMGQFENHLCSITVQANEVGVAEATFLATPGVIEDVHILAASPKTSGQVRYLVNVQLPKDSGAAATK